MQYFVEGLFSVLQTVIILSMYFPLMNKNAKKKKNKKKTNLWLHKGRSSDYNASRVRL